MSGKFNDAHPPKFNGLVPKDSSFWPHSHISHISHIQHPARTNMACPCMGRPSSNSSVFVFFQTPSWTFNIFETIMCSFFYESLHNHVSPGAVRPAEMRGWTTFQVEFPSCVAPYAMEKIAANTSESWVKMNLVLTNGLWWPKYVSWFWGSVAFCSIECFIKFWRPNAVWLSDDCNYVGNHAA